MNAAFARTRRPAATAHDASTPVIALDRVVKEYAGGVRALDEVSLTVARGTFLAVMGPSGSGKSTLMHCAAGLDSPTSGSVRIDGHEIGGLNENRRTELRRERVGFVFQSYNLIPSSASRTTSCCRCDWRAVPRTTTGCGLWWSGSVLPTGLPTARPNFPVASSNGPPS